MNEESKTLAVISKIYEAAVEPAGMNKLAGVLAEALGTRSGFIGLLSRPKDGQTNLPELVGLPSATENFDDWARAAYAEHYHRCNIWFATGIRRGFPAIVLGQELATPSALTRSEWFEFCQKLDAFHVLGAQIHLDHGLSVQFGAHRARRARSFDERDRRQMSLLLPHLQRALQIHVRLCLGGQVETLSMDVFERLGLGVLIVDQRKRMLFANALATRILDQQTALRIMNGKVFATQKALQFNRMIEGAGSASAGKGFGAGGMLVLPLDDTHSLRLLVSPLPPDRLQFAAVSEAVLILLSSPTALGSMPEQTVRDAYGLTAAETRLLSALMAGEHLTDYADRLEISIATVRTHMKRLLSKTGHHRQLDLIRSLASDQLLRLADTDPMSG